MKKCLLFIMSFCLCAFTVFGMTKEEFTAELEKVGSNITITEAQKKAEIKKIMQAALASGLDQASVVQVSVETSGLNPIEAVVFLIQEGVDEKGLDSGTDAAFKYTKEKFTEDLNKMNEDANMTAAQKKAEAELLIQEAIDSGMKQDEVVQISVEASGLDPVETVSLLVQEGVEEQALASGTDAAGVPSAIVDQGKQQAELLQEEKQAELIPEEEKQAELAQGKQQAELVQEEEQEQLAQGEEQEPGDTGADTAFGLTEEQFSEELASINENTEMTDVQKQAAVESLIQDALSSGMDQAVVVKISIEASGLNPVAVVSFLVQEGVEENALVSGADSAGISPGIVAQAQKQAEVAMGVDSGDTGAELGFSDTLGDTPAPGPVAIVTGPVAGGGGNRPASPSTP